MKEKGGLRSPKETVLDQLQMDKMHRNVEEENLQQQQITFPTLPFHLFFTFFPKTLTLVLPWSRSYAIQRQFASRDPISPPDPTMSRDPQRNSAPAEVTVRRRSQPPAPGSSQMRSLRSGLLLRSSRSELCFPADSSGRRSRCRPSCYS